MALTTANALKALEERRKKEEERRLGNTNSNKTSTTNKSSTVAKENTYTKVNTDSNKPEKKNLSTANALAALQKRRERAGETSRTFPTVEKSTVGNTSSKYIKGNIDLSKRPRLINEDGTISTLDSVSFYDERDGKETLVPTVINIDDKWYHVSPEEAWEHYLKTGEHLGKFNSQVEANAFGNWFHQAEGKKIKAEDERLEKEKKLGELKTKQIQNDAKNTSDYWEKRYNEEMDRLRVEHSNDAGFPVGAHAIAIVDKERKDLEDEQKNLKNEIEALVADLNGYRDATLKDLTINSLKRGYYNAKYGEETWDMISGRENEAEKYAELLESDDFKFYADSWWKKGLSGALEQLGLRAESWDGETAAATGAGALTGAGIAMGAGQAGPQVLLPEEAITVPGMAILGAVAGYSAAMSGKIAKVEGGLAYNEMIEAGVTPETAEKIALVVGSINGGLEALQTKTLLDAFGGLTKIGTSSSVATEILKELGRRGIDIFGKEVPQELLQESTTMAGVEIGSRLDNDVGVFTKEDVKERLKETALSTTLSMGFSNLLPASYNSAQIINNYNKIGNIGKTYSVDTEAVIQEGLDSDPDSEAHRIAQELQNKLDAGETISNVELGRAVIANENEIRRENANADVEEQPTTLEEVAQAFVNDRENGRMGEISEEKTAVDNSSIRTVETETKPVNAIGQITDKTKSLLGDTERTVGIADGQAFVTNGKDILPSPANRGVFLPVDNVESAKTELGATESNKVGANVSKILNQSDFTPIVKNPVEGNLEGIGTVRVFTDENGREIALEKNVAEYFEGYNLEATFRGGKPYAIKATDNDGNVAGVAMAIWSDTSGQKYNITDVKAVESNVKVAESKTPYNVMSNENPLVQERKARENYIKKATGYGDYGVKAFANIMETLSENEAPLVASEFNIAYQYGVLNANSNTIDSSSAVQVAAYKAGLQDYNAELATKKANVKNVVSHGDKAGFDRTNVPSNVSAEAIDIVDKVYRLMGAQGRMTGPSDLYNANILENKGVVEVASDFNVIEKLGKDAVSKSFITHNLHEVLDHYAEELAPEEYMEFKREMYLYKNSLPGVDLAKAKRAFYAQRKVDISYSEAISEVNANSIFELYDNDINLLAKGIDRVMKGDNAKAKKGANAFFKALDYVIDKFNKVLEKFGSDKRIKYLSAIDETTRLRDLLEKTLSVAVAKSKEIAAKSSEQTTAQKNTDLSDGIKFDLKENYTAQEYNDYGWARANNILNEGENADYRSKFAMVISKQAQFEKSKNGEYIIPVSDIYDADFEGINNTLVFAKGTIDKPVISCIIKILEYTETEVSVIRSDIYALERKGIRQETGGSVVRYNASDFQSNYYEYAYGSGRDNNGNGVRGRDSGETSGYAERGVDKKFSLKEKSYIDAVNKGDMVTAQAMVDEAAKQAGYTVKAYHGTPNNGFTVFNKNRIGKGNDQYGAGFYFASEEDVAKRYGSRLIPTRLSVSNPIKLDGSSTEGANLINGGYDYLLTEEQAYEVIKRLPNIFDAEESPLGDYYDSYWESGAEDWMIEDLASNEANRNIGYLDSDLFRNYPNELHEAIRDVVGYDGVEVTFKNGDKFYVAWFDNQMKSAEPVTYDDNGNVIPLSERFNPDNEDIRFSLKEPVEESKNLIAMHNLTEEKLLKSLALGGFPMPSIAVTKADIPHTNFGDITLVMNKSTVDPKANKKNSVYSADAWTPVFPSVEYEANPKAVKRLQTKYYDLVNKFGRDKVDVLYSYGNTLEDALNRQGGAEGIISRLKDDTKMMNVFLLDTGKDQVENVYKEKVTRLSDSNIEMYDFVINGLGEDVINEMYPTDEETGFTARKRWLEAHGEALRKVYVDYLSSQGMSEEEINDFMDSPNMKPGMLVRDVALPARNYLKNGAETKTREFDYNATQEAIKSAVDTKAYEKWLQENFADVEKSQGIYNNKDFYTSSGKRRSFKETHYPVTLENVVKAMASQNDGNTKNVSGFVGIKTLRAGTAERFKSIADMHNRSDRLQHLTEAEAEAINDALSKRMTDIMSRILEKSNNANDNPYIAMDAIGETLSEVAESGKYTIDSIAKTFAQYRYNIGNAIATDIRDLLFDVSQMPVNIFEAKPERAVGFDEVLSAVIPDTASENLRTQLENAGVNVLTYQKGNDADRVAKVNSVEDVRFSLKGTEQEMSLKEVAKLKKTISDMKERHAETVKEIKAEFKDQLKVSKVAKTDKKALEKTAKALVKEYESGVDINEIQTALDDLYTYMANGDEGNVSWNELYSRAYDIASNILKNVSIVEDSSYQDALDLRAYFRNTAISLNPMYNHDIPGYESINDFRKSNFGRIKLTKDGTPIDALWGEMSSLFPGYFSADEKISPPDMLSQVADVLDSIKPLEHNPYSYNMREASTYLANDIIERFYDLPQMKTIADKAKNKVVMAKVEGFNKLQKLREQKNEKIKEAVAEGREKAKKAVLGEKMAAARDLQKMRDKYEKRIEKMGETEKAKVIRAKILRHTNDLSKKLLQPTDKQHIPENLKGAVAKLLECINLESNYSYDPKTDSYKKNDEGLPTRRTKAFNELKELYVNMAGELTVDPDLMGDNGLLSEVIYLSDIRLADMTTAELQIVWEALQAIEATITTANKMFSEGKFETISSVADAIRTENIGKNKKTELRYVGGLQKLTSLDMLTPETYFHMLGDAGDSIFRMMRNAQDKHISIMKEVSDFTHKELKDVNVNKLESKLHTVTLGGKDVKLTTAQLMELYALMRRDQAREHILVGGILPDVINKGPKKITEVEPIRGISAEEIGKALTLLTESEKAIADKLQRFVSSVLSEYGNEASMQVYNYKKFNEKNYWTIRTNKQEIQSDISKDTAVTTVANRGFTKGTKPHANTSVRIGSIFDTFSAHASDMATYAAWLGTSEDVNRIRNFVFWEDGARTGTVKGVLDRVHGLQGSKYLEKLLTDIAIGVKGVDDMNPLAKLTGHYKAAAIGANIRVVIQQPTAMLRALDMIGVQYLTIGTAKNPLKGWKKAKKYAPIAQWKDWGHFDINTGRQMKDVLFDNASVLEKTKQVGMWGASKADSVSWGTLWNAVESETKAKRKDLTVGSEDFYKAVAERFTEIIDHTQVVDGILQRSQIMRSRSDLVKMATSFMGEPTKQYNMAMASAYDAKNKTGVARKEAVGRLGRTALSLAISGIVNACAQSIVDALRDDDKEKEYWEKWLAAFAGIGEDEKITDSNLVDTFNPLTYIPFAKDIVSIFEGYDVKRMDTEAITKTVNATTNMYKAITGESKYTIAGASANLFAESARLFGLPVANVKRDVKSIVTTTLIETDNYVGQYRLEKASLKMNYSGNQKTFLDILFNAYTNDKEAYEIIYADMIKEDKLKTDAKTTAEVIASAMDNRMKKAEGVTEVTDLKNRYLPPDKEKSYTSKLKTITNSSAWKSADTEARKDAKNLLHGIVSGNDKEALEKLDEGKVFGLDETEYVLYKLALDVANTDGNGSYSAKEKAEAIDTLSLGNSEIGYLWGTEQALEAWSYGIDMNGYANFKGAVSVIKRREGESDKAYSNRRKETVKDLANEYSRNEKEKLYLMSTVYDSYKKYLD